MTEKPRHDFPDRRQTARLELWGGAEYTLNRVGDRFFDQMRRSGHAGRLSDLARFAALGITALRCPVLWDQICGDAAEAEDWRRADAYLRETRALGMAPIVGLLHHGSGPRHTDLLDGGFAAGLAGHAARAARRYPWVRYWTPVNEPTTTARFSALYGQWYPHLRDERAFWLALINQVDATRLAMRAIRAIIPDALLVQTDDLGRTFSTRRMAGQAAFDNHRRWMGWDLLCGMVVRGHPLWARLAGLGFADRLEALADDPCRPDIIGVNHYLTSDRFLDHRTRRYPARLVGGNSYGRFADVEAVRVLDPYDGGLERALREAWGRYAIPIALTEIHNGCTREEQMRWMHEAWTTAERLRAEAVDIRAVTAWSLLGAYDWNTLLTSAAGHYETGVFDLAGGRPRATAMAGLLKALVAGRPDAHPVLNQPGWWRRDIRLLYPPVRIGKARSAATRAQPAATPPLLITGASGTLGRALAAACELRGIHYRLTDRATLPLDDPAAIDRVLDGARPWAVINTAGWVRVDDAEREPEGCLSANRDGSLNLGRACADRDIPYVTFSSDLVFDGRSDRPYVETDGAAPLSVYGRSKAEADRELLSWTARVLVIRTAAFFSPHDPYNFAMALVRSLRHRQRFRAADDCRISPTFVPDLVRRTLDLVIDGERGLWHLANSGATSWAEFARAIAGAARLDAGLVLPCPAAEMGWTAARPRMAALGSEHGQLLPSLDTAIGDFASALAA